jgi:FkbM family methyltransferase
MYAIAKSDMISRSLFIRGTYGVKPQKLAYEILKKTGFEFHCLINVGANIGTTVIQLAEYGFQHGIAIEPHPRTYKLLKTNLELNGLLKYKSYNIALGSHKGFTSLTNNTNLGVNEISLTNTEDSIRVKINTLDEIVAVSESPLEPHGTLLWMDVQGFEYEVLLGGQIFLKNICPLVIEFWPQEMSKHSFRIDLVNLDYK